MVQLIRFYESIFALLCILIKLSLTEPPYKPEWSSLDKRPIPLWFDDVKFGIFINWGLYSVPSYGSEWFWWYWQGEKSEKYVDFMRKNYKQNFTYADFGPLLTAEMFNPDRWADMIVRSGAKYVVFSTKHHEGYTMYPSDYSWNWNSLEVGPQKDITQLVGMAMRNRKLIFGIYFSQFEWFHPLYLRDVKNNFNTSLYPSTVSIPQMYEIVAAYKPDVIWSDGDWEGPDYYWKSQEFLAWLYNESPMKDKVVVNDRWGNGIPCKHGDFYTCQDRYNPGILQKHKWENCYTIFKTSWGFDRAGRLNDYLSTKELINTLVETVSCGGNLLLNIAPTVDGRIVPIFEERLSEMGQWLEINGQAIYGTKPWLHQNDTTTPNVWYTSKVLQAKGFNPRRLQNPQQKGNTIIFATFFDWPPTGLLKLGALISTSDTTIQLLGTDLKLPWKPLQSGVGVTVDLADVAFDQMPSFMAWTLKIDNLKTYVKE